MSFNGTLRPECLDQESENNISFCGDLGMLDDALLVNFGISRAAYLLRQRIGRLSGGSLRYSASFTQRNPRAPERSYPAAIINSLPCVLFLYAWGKYQIEPCGW